VEIRGAVATGCLHAAIAQSNPACPNFEEVTACAAAHCELGACLKACEEFTTCLAGVEDPCADMFSCPSSDACTDCRQQLATCTFNFCAEQLACAPAVTPDGPCAQLESCCAMQGDGAESCLEIVRTLEKFSGDVSCRGAMVDWDTAAHLAVPCRFN
jgi:hypothetical protein